MRRPFTGVAPRSSRRSPQAGALDEAAVRAWRVGRSTPASTSSCPCGTTGETRRSTDATSAASSRSSSTRRAAGCRSWPAPAATTRRGHSRGATRWQRPAPTAPVGHAVLQQADAGRAVPALRADRRSTRCRSSLYNVPGRTGCNVEPATLAAWRTIPQHRRRQGSVGQHARRCARSAARARRLHRAVGRRRADAAADGGRRPRRHLGGVERDAGRDGADGRGAERGDFAGARAISRAAPAADAGQLRRVEPGPGEGRDGGDGPARRGYRLPMVPPRPERRRRRCVAASSKELGLLGRAMGARASTTSRARTSRRLWSPPAPARRSRRRPRDAFARCARRCRPGRCAPPSRIASADRLARQHVGEAGHPARLPLRRHRRRVDGPRPAGRSTTRTRCR